MKKKVKYNPEFPIEEIVRANAALELGTGIMWRRETHSVKTWREKVAITELKIDSKPYNQHDGDVYTVLSNGKTNYDYLLELKHQNSLSMNEHDDLITCYVSRNWVDNCDNPQYPRMAYGICLPRENTLYYCNTLKSAIKKAIKGKGNKLVKRDGKYTIKVHKNSFKKVERKVTKKDLATWEFVQENAIKIYGRKQNYFEPEEEVEEEVVPVIEEVVRPIDKLIERKKRQVSELEAEIAKLEEFALTRKLLSDKYGEEIVG